MIILLMQVLTVNTLQKKQLKAKAHALKPCIILGYKGLTEPVNLEIAQALQHHELIKVRISTNDRELRKAIFSEICKIHDAIPIQSIGHVITIYKKNEQ